MTARTDTQLIPVVRLYPPTQPDRRTGWKLTRRGQIVAKSASGAAILGAALAVDPISHAFWSFTAAVSQIAGIQ